MHIEQIRSVLAHGLRARRGEIEQAIMTRVYTISEPVEASDPEYGHGLRAAVPAAFDYGVNALEQTGDRAPPIPAVLLAQTRLAARSGVSLDMVLRRYLAGYTLWGDFVIQESGHLTRGSLQRLLRVQATLLDRLFAAVSEEYSREECNRLDSVAQRRADQVKRLLAGELLEASEFTYELGDYHLGMVATGPGVTTALTQLAKSIDRRLLMTGCEPGKVWAWLGARRTLNPEEVKDLAALEWPGGVSVAIGEPAQGIPGWRSTHRQAAAAFPIALRSPENVVCYADVALLASMVRDELLLSSLRSRYLIPFEQDRDRGEVLLQTLRAYFSAGRNASSAAAALGVSRRTVTNRLRVTEARLGRSLTANTLEIEAALRLQELDTYSPE